MASSDTNQRLINALSKFTDVKIQTSRQESRQAISLCLENIVKPVLQRVAEYEPRFKAEPPIPTSTYFEGLRVSALNEFEFLVSLVNLLSFRGFDDVGKRDPKYGCYGYLVAKHSNFEIDDLVEKIPKRASPEGYTGLGVMSAKKVKEKFYKLVQTAVENLSLSPELNTKVYLQGSSDTIPVLKVQHGDRMYNIELVPCITLQSDWPPTAEGWGNETNAWLTAEEAKEVKKFGFQLLPTRCPLDADDGNLWRLSFCRGEKFLLKHSNIDSVNGNGRRKQCERILKTIREANREAFLPLVSYHIKTVFLHESMKFPDPSQWTKDKLGERFKGLLRSLIYALEKGQCPHFFVRGCNLFAYYSQADLSRVAVLLRDILGSVTNHPDACKYLE
ncbi:cyclic GMP-AMP synthase-like receptor 1 [Saccoglossus kowalevskii]|uniref:Cyclic GMP-AMP synthase-like n=1 Tax=Saccoglossus kowalevskii TaxID=10224 RepID=A0ABM0GZH1_SACKO|nr:PREDICTED: cyclic GMP-AMP synthase-like [Saccoglossus kowalevskii]